MVRHKKYPAAKFASTKVEKLSSETGRITGELTIKGVSKPVTLDVKPNFSGMHPYVANGLSMGFDAKGEVKRSDFGVGAFAPAVSDTIKLDIQTEFNKKR
ncbi:MAG: YceI family protein [Hyphomicrobiales bacterium]|nr:YceI family protein [Hyphomicrobiales bacterium]